MRPPAALDVRIWHKADMLNALTNVHFEGNDGHGADLSVCPLMTNSEHQTLARRSRSWCRWWGQRQGKPPEGAIP